ncbi:hypothetical protein [Nocardioides sp.]|jgi:hypothetical protein|uniref:hypothetical protein n=1 Tax=Nocardioides sp. TaxID=35761 RepID=UPI0031FEECC2|nr:hypothetical protein [Nocardioides sp.]
MNFRTHITRITAVTALAALALGVAAPAMAERIGVSDPADVGGASLSDIRRVTVNHGLEQIFVKVAFTELKPKSEAGPSSLAIFLDTNANKKGPEFLLGTGLQRGTDYQLTRVRDWKTVGQPLTCDHSLRLDFVANVAKLHAARSCIGTPDEIRVGVKMTDLYDGSHPVHDWLGKPRSFTPWVVSS